MDVLEAWKVEERLCLLPEISHLFSAIASSMPANLVLNLGATPPLYFNTLPMTLDGTSSDLCFALLADFSSLATTSPLANSRNFTYRLRCRPIAQSFRRCSALAGRPCGLIAVAPPVVAVHGLVVRCVGPSSLIKVPAFALYKCCRPRSPCVVFVVGQNALSGYGR